MQNAELKNRLDDAVWRFNRPEFIANDPICVPHRFQGLQDREIMGFWTAVLAWGQRAAIIKSAERLVEWMDGEPYAFITGHSEPERARFERFAHRTFNGVDALYFLDYLQRFYRSHPSLEDAFARHLQPDDANVENALRGFHLDFFDHPWAPARTRKHLPTPARGSTCKRLNMFLRWMVRRDEAGVDFGVWRRIRPSQLLMPLDVHVDRIARRMGLLSRKQTDWAAVLELTGRLKAFAPDDPVRFDFALFGLGVLENETASAFFR